MSIYQNMLVFLRSKGILGNGLMHFLVRHTSIEKIWFHAGMDDQSYIIKKYREAFGVEPDLEHPKTFNEKNNWRKLHERNPLYTSMVDKYKIKQIIAERVGAEHTFPLLGVWDRPEDIEFDKLPDQFVLKANHAGGVAVCRSQKSFDRKEALRYLNYTQSIDYFIRSREWPYKNVDRKIIAEQYMGEDLIDYKNYCFGGKLMYTLVWQNHSLADGSKPEAHFCGAYDRNWERTTLEIDYPTDDLRFEKPECYDELVEVCEKMSAGIPFVRVDCYIIGGHVYVGEMTFFPWGGFQKFKDEAWNKRLGDLIQLQDPM